MCDVYRGSTLNIIATASKNGQGGYFRDRIPGQQSKELKLQIGNSIYSFLDSKIWRNNVEAGPLCRRGWVIQERILSQRTLHFGETRLFWECRELHASETQLHGLVHHVLSIPIKSVSFSCPYFWENEVSRYSETSLTKESDKLSAISGIAKFVKFNTGDQYFADLWRKYIETQLLWSRPRPNDKKCRSPEKYRAPSWS